mgnify:CR=1 FL=1
MKELKSNINRIIEFGMNPNVASKNKLLEVKQLLVAIYFVYLNSDDVEINGDFEEDFSFSYEKIKKNVESNFPDFSWYINTWNISKIEFEKGEEKPIVNSDLGDSVDDLSDIIKDLLEVKWRFENTSNNDAIWHFNFLMKNHSEQHLLDLLKYLKDVEND